MGPVGRSCYVHVTFSQLYVSATNTFVKSASDKDHFLYNLFLSEVLLLFNMYNPLSFIICVDPSRVTLWAGSPFGTSEVTK